MCFVQPVYIYPAMAYPAMPMLPSPQMGWTNSVASPLGSNYFESPAGNMRMTPQFGMSALYGFPSRSSDRDSDKDSQVPREQLRLIPSPIHMVSPRPMFYPMSHSYAPSPINAGPEGTMFQVPMPLMTPRGPSGPSM